MRSISVIIAIVCLTSCNKDWLEEKSDKTQAIPATLEDFQAMMDDYFTLNAQRIQLGEVASDGHYVLEGAWNTATDKAKNAYTWSNSRPYLALPGVTEWPGTYKRVFSSNIVIDGLKREDLSNTYSGRNIMGQALVHRADAFFWAAQTWAPPYDLNGSNGQALSIPLRLEPDVVLPTTRSTIAQTYNQIISDLQQAKDLLPEEQNFKTRPSKSGAYALLARVYLVMGMYQEAAVAADSCLKISNTLLDYNLPGGSSNFIGDFRTNPEVILHYTMSTNGVSGFLTNNCFINPALYNTYDSNDLRKTRFFRVNTNGTISFRGNYNNSATSLFCGPSTSEIMLLRAECYARAGETANAMSFLNNLLRSRWKKNIDGSSTYVDRVAPDSFAALKLILSEREKELILRGLRWIDLRRLNQENQLQSTLVRTIGGNTYTLQPNSFQYTFPIPQDIISQTGILQNTGW